MKGHLHAFHEIFAPLGAPLREKPEVKPCPFAAFEAMSDAKHPRPLCVGDRVRYADCDVTRRFGVVGKGSGIVAGFSECGVSVLYVNGSSDEIQFLEVIDAIGV